MRDVDACAELLKRVRAIREEIGAPHEMTVVVDYEETKDGYRKINQTTQCPPKRVSAEQLFRASFVAWLALREIEEMLDPANRSFWRLHLKQRRRGGHTVPLAIAASIYSDYGDARCVEPKTPIKTIIGKLADEYGVSDTAIKEIVRRKHGKKPKRKPKR
jgi:hypothetical protein